MLFLKTFLKMYFLQLFSFYLECIRKRQITQLVIYFAVSYLATKHKSGLRNLLITFYVKRLGVISRIGHSMTSQNYHVLYQKDVFLTSRWLQFWISNWRHRDHLRYLGGILIKRSSYCCAVKRILRGYTFSQDVHLTLRIHNE